MRSSMGFGAYDNFGIDITDVVGAVKGLAKGATGIVFEAVEITEPPELAGAKLSQAFKIIKDGEDYKIALDLATAEKLIGASVPGSIGKFAAQKIPDIKQPHKVDLGIGVIEYIPPESKISPKLIAIAAVAAIIVAVLLFR